jgi:hypothetical protein
MKRNMVFVKHASVLAGLLAAALVFGSVLAGCASLFGNKGVETELSKSLKDAANDIVLTKDDGIAPAAFVAAFEKQFPGLNFNRYGGDIGSLNDIGKALRFKYQEKSFSMEFTGRIQIGSPSGNWTHITSVVSCKEDQPK